MVNLWPNDPVKGIKLRESEDYLEKKEKPSPPPTSPPWVVKYLQPLVIGIMVACISQSFAQLLRQMTPGWRHHFFIIAPVFASLAGYATHQMIRNRLSSGNESMRYQIYELVLIFILCKITTHLNHTIPELITIVKGWFNDPMTFFDGETILMFLLSLAAWYAAATTARDLYLISDPTLYVGETSPMKRITTRFFVGGLIIIISSAFARVKIVELLQTDRTRVPGILPGILIYFMLGLFMLGQLNFAHHTGLWYRQKVRINTGVTLVWLRYSLIFLAIVTFLAFLLPTGYTVGLLDLVRYIISAIVLIANLFVFLLSYPFLLLLSLLFPGREVEMPAPVTPMAARPPDVPSVKPDNAWLEIMRSIIFWVLALVAIGVVLRGYIRDHPDMFAFFRKLSPVRWLTSLYHSFRLLLKRLKTTIEKTMPKLVERLRRRVPRRLLRTNRRRGDGQRELILYHYLNTLDVAREEGLARKKTQTPYEFGKVLASNLDESTSILTRLTDIFVQARYSNNTFTQEIVETTEKDAKDIQDHLRKLKENKGEFIIQEKTSTE